MNLAPTIVQTAVLAMLGLVITWYFRGRFELQAQLFAAEIGRLDDRLARVERVLEQTATKAQFESLQADIAETRTEVRLRALQVDIDRRFDEVDRRFEQVDSRFDQWIDGLSR